MAGPAQIDRISFSVSDSENNERMGVCAINKYELYSSDGTPISGGPFDARLGTTENSIRCISCMKGKKHCIGHNGYLYLNYPMLQPIAIDTIRKWLNLVCFNDGTILADKETYIHAPMSRRLFHANDKLKPNAICPNCGTIHSKIEKDTEDYFTTWMITYIKNVPKRTKIYPHMIERILNMISQSEAALLSKTQPSKLVLRVFNIPSIVFRVPSTMFDPSKPDGVFHDTTNILQHFIRRNMLLPAKVPDVIDIDLDRNIQNMQQISYDIIKGAAVATAGNKGKRTTAFGFKPTQGYLGKIVGKKRRIRGNILGARVKYNSRTTICGDCSIRIDELAVPISFAKILQVKEIVQEFNLVRLTSHFVNGRNNYPGCTYIQRKGELDLLDPNTIVNSSLGIGDTIWRDLVDGDYINFNRQPSLEISNITMLKAKIIRNSDIYCFMFNVLACVLYNADFDGDQMNAYALRSYMARVEALIMSYAPNWYISVKSCSPTWGQIQDSVVGCAKLTRTDTVMNKYHAMQMFSTIGISKLEESSDHIYTGRDIVSLLLKKNQIDYIRKPTCFDDFYVANYKYNDKESKVVIEGGNMKSGILDKSSVGLSTPGTIFHVINHEYGGRAAITAVFEFQQVALQLLLSKGLTVGISDIILPASVNDNISRLASVAELKSKLISNQLERKEIIPPIHSTVEDHYELLQINALNVNEESLMREILSNIDINSNGFAQMISHGSRGKIANLKHVMGCIGQTKINGSRMDEGLAFKRTYIYYPRFTTDPVAHGFVRNSYAMGMTLPEVCSQSKAGRYDIISKALATGISGFFSRRCKMSMESAITDNHRRTLKNTKIVQMIYGEDGLDARSLERVEFRLVMMSNEELKNETWVELPEAQSEIDVVITKLFEARDNFREIFIRMEAVTSLPFNTNVLMPVNIKRTVDKMLINMTPEKNNTADIMKSKLNLIEDLCERLPYKLVNEIQERKRSKIPKCKIVATTLMKMLIRFELNPKILAKLTSEQLDSVIKIIEYKYCESLIDYGTAVASIASQAISHQLTQSVLDSHHRSVGAETSKSEITRINELYGAEDIKLSQTSMRIPMINVTKEEAQIIANEIEYITLRQFAINYEILLEDIKSLKYPKYKNDSVWIREFNEFNPLIKPPSDLTNWCLRIAINKSQMVVVKNVQLETIIRRLREENQHIYVVHNPEVSKSIVVRIWFQSAGIRTETATIKVQDRITTLVDKILDTKIRGIENIMNVSVEVSNRLHVNEDGSMTKKQKIVLNTVGSNLEEILMLDNVDSANVTSSSVWDTLRVFGVMAARDKIMRMTRNIMGGDTPNPRHLQIFADEMTRLGGYLNIERGGLNTREPDNVLLRMGYGDPVRTVIDAAVNNVSSKIYGLTASRMVGSLPRVGTRYNTFEIDEEFVIKNTQTIDSALDDILNS